jgi:hypothetical protein
VPGPETASPSSPAPATPPPGPDTASEVVRWAAFSCVLVPVVLVGFGTSLAGAAGTALGLAAVTGVCRVLLRQSERVAARLHAEGPAPSRARHSRTGRHDGAPHHHHGRPGRGRRGRPEAPRGERDPGTPDRGDGGRGEAGGDERGSGTRYGGDRGSGPRDGGDRAHGETSHAEGTAPDTRSPTGQDEHPGNLITWDRTPQSLITWGQGPQGTVPRGRETQRPSTQEWPPYARDAQDPDTYA